MTFRLDNMVEQQQVVKIEVAVPAVVAYADANITDNYANGQMVKGRLAYNENDKKISHARVYSPGQMLPVNVVPECPVLGMEDLWETIMSCSRCECCKAFNFVKNLFMKKLTFLVSVIICFVSCYEVNEEITINQNGGGTFVTKMDMGQMLEMIQSMAGEEELVKEGLDKAIDTTIFMKSILDSVKDATAEQKQLMQDGKMNLQMNMKEKLFKAQIDIPFKKHNDLQSLMSGNGNSMSGLSQLFKGAFDKGDQKKPELDSPKEPGLDDLNTIFDVTVKDGLISKKVNLERHKALIARPEIAQLQQMATGGMEILYTTTIKLPRPAKKTENAIVKLSDDKKTVTLKYNLLDLFDHPEKFSYSVQY